MTLRQLVWLSDGRGRAEWDRTAALIVTVAGVMGVKLDPSEINPYRRESGPKAETPEQKELRKLLFMRKLGAGLKSFAESQKGNPGG